jgi:hypothetical protein
MSNHPRRQRPRRNRAAGHRPTRLPWTVHLIHDGDPELGCDNPDCTHDGHEPDPDFVPFAYTSGLHKLGLPELWISTRSRDGSEEVPLQHAGIALNVIAENMRRGVLDLAVDEPLALCAHCITRHEPGCSCAWIENYHLADEPVMVEHGPPSTSYRETLETFQTHPAAEVVPLTWGHWHELDEPELVDAS